MVDEFKELEATQKLFETFPRPWFFCGGWAIDLFLGYKTREHSDVEVGVFREDQSILQKHLQGWSLSYIDEGEKKVWKEDIYLQLPVHELIASSGLLEIEILLNEKQLDEWQFRRNQQITLPIERLILWRNNIPFLCPEVVLLYKAKRSRAKDKQDLELALPHLEARQIKWLKNGLIRMDLLHPWLGYFKTT